MFLRMSSVFVILAASAMVAPTSVIAAMFQADNLVIEFNDDNLNTKLDLDEFISWDLLSGDTDLDYPFLIYINPDPFPASTSTPDLSDLLVAGGDCGGNVSYFCFSDTPGGLPGSLVTPLGATSIVGLGNGTPSPIPVPAAAWLFVTALIGLAGFSKRKKAA